MAETREVTESEISHQAADLLCEGRRCGSEACTENGGFILCQGKSGDAHNERPIANDLRRNPLSHQKRTSSATERHFQMTAPKPRHFVIVVLMCSLMLAQTKKPDESNVASTKDMAVTTLTTAPSNFVIFNNDNCEMVKISMGDGKVVFGKCYKPDEAAEIFWTYLGSKSPTALQKRIDELEAEVKKLKAGTNGK